jgi:hypothetical protein
MATYLEVAFRRAKEITRGLRTHNELLQSFDLGGQLR